MGRRSWWKRPLRLKVTKDGIEMQGNTGKDMELLTELSQRVQKPHETRVSKDGLSTTGYGDPGEKKALLWGAIALAGLALGALGRRLYHKYIKKSNPVIALPAPPVIDVPCVEVVEQEPVEEPVEEEFSSKPERKEWSEWFLDEFGSMPDLPPILDYVISRSPLGYEAAMVFHLLCAFAALCFSKVRAKYLDGNIHAPNLMVIIEGDWGAGKDKLAKAFHTLFKRIIERDRGKSSSLGEDTILQYVGVGASESWFIDTLANNKGVHMFMFSNEILAIINSMKKNNGLSFFHLRQAFDNGFVYRYNKSGAPQGQFPVFLGISATGTPGDTNRLMSKELEGGSASRFIYSKIPDVRRFLESLDLPEGEELEEMRNQIDDWNKTHCYHHDSSSGRDVPADEFYIDLEYVNKPLNKWITDEQWVRSGKNDNHPRMGARGRMGAIAFHMAMVIHMLYGNPGPEKQEIREKVINLTIYLANYCMERFMHKFGDIQKVQRDLNNQAEMVEPETVIYRESDNSTSQPDEEKYSGQFTKSEVIRMKRLYDMMGPNFGYGQVAKVFGLPPGSTSKQAVKRAIEKLRDEQQGK